MAMMTKLLLLLLLHCRAGLPSQEAFGDGGGSQSSGPRDLSRSIIYLFPVNMCEQDHYKQLECPSENGGSGRRQAGRHVRRSLRRPTWRWMDGCLREGNERNNLGHSEGGNSFFFFDCQHDRAAEPNPTHVCAYLTTPIPHAFNAQEGDHFNLSCVFLSSPQKGARIE